MSGRNRRQEAAGRDPAPLRPLLIRRKGESGSILKALQPTTAQLLSWEQGPGLPLAETAVRVHHPAGVGWRLGLGALRYTGLVARVAGVRTSQNRRSTSSPVGRKRHMTSQVLPVPLSPGHEQAGPGGWCAGPGYMGFGRPQVRAEAVKTLNGLPGGLPWCWVPRAKLLGDPAFPALKLSLSSLGQAGPSGGMGRGRNLPTPPRQ